MADSTASDFSVSSSRTADVKCNTLLANDARGGVATLLGSRRRLAGPPLESGNVVSRRASAKANDDRSDDGRQD